ncbi:ECF transporter S component, partial [Eubacterium sp. MSJ-13]|uniref:ECF transporter S component n=1 Tax=Eubacterium sp. MSJ-13 TaxID=2841513 RepID=UPI001C0FCAC0
SNFILGCAFVVPAGVIYKKKSDKKGAVLASLTGTVAMSLLSIVSNYFFVYPIYYNFMPKEMILKAYQAIFPGVHSILQALVVFNVPFTLLKGVICVVFAWILYVPLAPMMRIEE